MPTVQITLTPTQVADVIAQNGATTTPPPPPPPPPPPATDEFRVLLPSAQMHEQPPQAFPDGTAWPGADFVRASALADREVPWIVPMFNAAAGEFCPPRNGVDPTTAHVLHVLGNPTQLYSQVQYFDARNAFRSDPFNPEIGDEFTTIVNDLTARPLPAGVRGVALSTPYLTVIPHPSRFPAGAPNAGQIIPRHPVASLVGHNGDWWLLYVIDGKVRLTYNGRLPGAKHIAHACVSRKDRTVIFVAELGTKIGANYAGSCVVRYDRVDAARGNATQDENVALYDRTVVIPSLQYASNVHTDKDGHLFAVDAGTGNVYRLDSGTGAVTIAGNVQFGYAITEISDQADPYVIGRDNMVRRLDLTPCATGGQFTAGPNLMPSGNVTTAAALGVDFWTASMDLEGSCGPVKNARFSRVHTGGNTNTYQFSNNGATVKSGQGIFMPSMQGWNTVGAFAQVKEPYGHYDWLGAIYGVGQGISFAGGYANVPMTVIAYNMPGLPTQYLGDYTLNWAGIAALRRWGFTTMVTAEGWSRFAGCSADELAEVAKTQGYAAFAARLTGGLSSAIPRPTLATWNNGLDLLALGVHLLCNSQRHLIDGKAFVDGWIAWWKSANPAVTVPSKFTTVLPSAIPDDPNGYLEARQSAPNQWRMGVFGIASANIRYLSGPAGMEKPTPIPADAMIVATYADAATGQVTSTTKITALPPGVECAFTVRSAQLGTRAIAARAA